MLWLQQSSMKPCSHYSALNSDNIDKQNRSSWHVIHVNCFDVLNTLYSIHFYSVHRSPFHRSWHRHYRSKVWGHLEKERKKSKIVLIFQITFRLWMTNGLLENPWKPLCNYVSTAENSYAGASFEFEVRRTKSIFQIKIIILTSSMSWLYFLFIW